MDKRVVAIHGTNILYTIRKNKRAKRVSIIVHDDGSVVVTKPTRVPLIMVDAFVRKQSEWIKAQLTKGKALRDAYATHLLPSYAESRTEASAFFQKRVAHFNAYYQLPVKSVVVRNQRTRWGSCSSAGVLSFNYRLFLMPLELADYVVVHEICHRAHPNHSKRFWSLVAEQIPDYKERRARLKGYPLH